MIRILSHKLLALILVGSLLGTASVPFPAQAQHEGHSEHQNMQHQKADSASSPLQEPGQSIFGTVQEAIQKLERDPETDWSEVDVDRLRRHLLDMHNVAVNVRVLDKDPVENGSRLTVQATTDSAHASLERVLSAHPPMLERETGWHMDVSTQAEQFVLRVTDPSGEAAKKIRALGYIGVLAYGAHHQRHHWVMLGGQSPDTHQ